MVWVGKGVVPCTGKKAGGVGEVTTQFTGTVDNTGVGAKIGCQVPRRTIEADTAPGKSGSRGLQRFKDLGCLGDRCPGAYNPPSNRNCPRARGHRDPDVVADGKTYRREGKGHVRMGGRLAMTRGDWK